MFNLSKLRIFTQIIDITWQDSAEIRIIASAKARIMSDVLTSAQRHSNMASIHSASTRPELILRRSLWRLGFRYRVNDKRLPGKPDIVLPRYRTVIFVNGCFWHGHKSCPNYTIPKTNTEFWKAKIERNQKRDQETWRLLEAKGWYVLIVWECELKKTRLCETIESVTAQIHRNGEIFRSAQDDRRKAREEYRQLRRELKDREAACTEELHQKYPR